MAALVSVPLVVAWITLARQPWYPTGDMAQAELHVRGIWRHVPLVGAAGRIASDTGVQGSHPGPSLWFAMYPVYALFGRSSVGLIAGAASVSIASIALSLWLALRKAGAVGVAVVALLIALLVRASGPDVFTEPWNPWLAFLPFVAFVITVWAAIGGDRRLWPLAVVLGSHCIQCHTGYIVVVLGLLGAAGAVVVVGALRDPQERRPTIQWLVWSIVAGIAMWILPLIDQLTRTPGNASILFQHFGSPTEPYIAKRDALEAIANQMSVIGPWVSGPEIPWVFWPATVAFVALWAAALFVALHRRERSEMHLHGVLLMSAVLAVVSVTRIFGPYFEYTVRWLWVVAGGAVAASVVTLARSIPSVASLDRRHLRAGLAAATVAVSLVASVQFAARAEIAGVGDGRLVEGLSDPVEAALDGDAQYLLRWWDPAGLGGPGFGLQLELERRGISVGVDEQFAAASLPHRVLAEADSDGVLYLVIGPKADEVSGTPGLTEIATFDPRTPDEKMRSDELRALLVEGLAAAGRDELIPALDAQYGQARLIFADPPLPPDLAEIAGEFVDLRLPGTVYLAEPGTPVPALGIG